jgi:hypothetical protein
MRWKTTKYKCFTKKKEWERRIQRTHKQTGSRSIPLLFIHSLPWVKARSLVYVSYPVRAGVAWTNHMEPAIDPTLSLTALYSLQKKVPWVKASSLILAAYPAVAGVVQTSDCDQRSICLSLLLSYTRNKKSTLSKGTLAYLCHVSRTSKRCVNQRHATSPIDSSLSLSLPLRHKQNTENSTPRVLQPPEKFPVYDVLFLSRE